MTSKSEKFAIVITGPTAVGKTELTIELARLHKTAIISADSRQFYKQLNIGTGKPTAEELQMAPHHFIGHLNIDAYYNVSRFENEALACIKALFKNTKVVFVTGGSGLYIEAFCQGIDDLPDPDPEVRKKLQEIYETQGLQSLRFMLQRYDPEYYNTTDLANPKRIMRALEVCMATGRKYSELRTNNPKKRPFNIIKVGLDRPREELFDRINNRVDAMMAQGLLEEARKLHKYKHLNALNTVGYKELFEHLENKISLAQAVENIKTNTRRYAKRQLTWFKKDTEFEWFHPEEKDNLIQYIEKRVNE